jgi:hypothetical protein
MITNHRRRARSSPKTRGTSELISRSPRGLESNRGLWAGARVGKSNPLQVRRSTRPDHGGLVAPPQTVSQPKCGRICGWPFKCRVRGALRPAGDRWARSRWLRSLSRAGTHVSQPGPQKIRVGKWAGEARVAGITAWEADTLPAELLPLEAGWLLQIEVSVGQGSNAHVRPGHRNHAQRLLGHECSGNAGRSRQIGSKRAWKKRRYFGS